MGSLSYLHHKYRYGAPCPNNFNFVTHVIERWARDSPSLSALYWVSADFTKERKLTYAELSALSKRAAIGFASLGIKKGDRVLIQLPRICEWWIALFGLMRVGAVPVPGTTLLVSSDLLYRAQSCNATAFIGDHYAISHFDEIAHKTQVRTLIHVRTDDNATLSASKADFNSILGDDRKSGKFEPAEQTKSTDLAMLYFTSGTTGKAKMVILNQTWTLGHIMSGEWYGLKPGQLFANLADLGWAKAAFATFGAFNLGGTLFVQTPPPGPFQPNTVIDMLHRYPIHTLCCPPTIYRALLSPEPLAYLASHQPQALEDAVGAGEPLNPSAIVEWRRATGVTVRDGYGQSETSICVANFKGEPVREGSMGKASPWYHMGVVDGDGRELGSGEEGELAIRTDCGAGSAGWIMEGYLLGSKVDRREKSYGGKSWYCTGDLVVRDADDYFWFVGRGDDVITSSGYRIGPFEVESTLKEHPAVLESAAVGSPDQARGEVVKAFIVLHPAAQAKLRTPADHDQLAAEIVTFFRFKTAPYKVPRKVEFVDSLPKTASGKIRRVELRIAEYKKKTGILAITESKL